MSKQFLESAEFDGYITVGNAWAPFVSSYDGIVYVSTANVTVSTAVTATLIGSGVGSLTIPANGLVAGRIIKIKAKGYLTTTTSASTLIFLAKLGATTIANTNGGTALAPTVSMTTAKLWEMELYITCRTVGTSGTIMPIGVFRTSTSATVTLNTANVSEILFSNTIPPAAVTINTTISQTIDFQVTDAGTGTTVVCTNFTVEVLN